MTARTKSAQKHIEDILAIAFEHSPAHEAVIVYDLRSELSIILYDAYRQALPQARLIDFDQATPEFILEVFNQLAPLDLAILIQSTSFRLDAYRVRVELFKRKLKVIEHPHLYRMTGEAALTYIESLAYDPQYYRGVGRKLKAHIDSAEVCVVESGGEELIFPAGFEPAKLNVGDYTGMANIGGQFPIGEVFTESKDLERVNGRVRTFAFADVAFQVNKPPTPITLIVEAGRVTAAEHSTPEFEEVLARIRADESEVWLRELGFGMNRAFTPERLVSDVGTYERMCGIHLSLGAKHAIYVKPGFGRRAGKHHVDVFAAANTVRLDQRIVFQNGAWQV